MRVARNGLWGPSWNDKPWKHSFCSANHHSCCKRACELPFCSANHHSCCKRAWELPFCSANRHSCCKQACELPFCSANRHSCCKQACELPFCSANRHSCCKSDSVSRRGERKGLHRSRGPVLSPCGERQGRLALTPGQFGPPR